MANTLLNSNVITNTALAVLHQRCNFLRAINKSYDNSFVSGGAAIGSQLRVRLPNQYSVRTGSAMNIQDIGENSVTLSVNNIAGIDAAFTDSDLAMNIVDFKAQFIEPAMKVLAAYIENDAFSMATDVYNETRNSGAMTVRQLGLARKALVDNLAPDDDFLLRVNTQDNVDMMDATKGLFNPNSVLADQYKSGKFYPALGFKDVAENTFLTTFTTGAGSRTAYLVNGASQTGSSLIVKTGTGAFVKGEVFTLVGVNRVHPETKANTGVLQQFVVTAAYAGGAGTLSISPAIVTSGATQNVSASPADNAQLTFSGTASTSNGLSLGFHKDAFTFATADLVIPNGVDEASRQVMDGISMRYVRAWDQANGRKTARFDVIYGYKTIRPQLAVRLAAN